MCVDQWWRTHGDQESHSTSVLDWILIAILYLCGIGFFRLIGGLGAAEDGLRRWGAAYGERQRERVTRRLRR